MCCVEVKKFGCSFLVDFDVNRDDGLPMVSIGENDLTEILDVHALNEIVAKAQREANQGGQEYDYAIYGR